LLDPYDILAWEPFSPELMPLTVVSADPPGRMIRWFYLAGITAASPWSFYRITGKSTNYIHRQ
jgi:hypothetical protein